MNIAQWFKSLVYHDSEELWLAFLQEAKLTDLSICELRMYTIFVEDELRKFRGDFVHDLVCFRNNPNTTYYWVAYNCGSYLAKNSTCIPKTGNKTYKVTVNEDGYVSEMEEGGSMINKSVTLTPAYGADYKSAKAAIAAFKEGKDWVLNSPFYPQTYCSIKDFVPGTSVVLRYGNMRKVTTVKA